ncbi:MAG: indolepyruvate ferredoxin oxidoreductase subunit alpha [Promethearchaeota archaeon]
MSNSSIPKIAQDDPGYKMIMLGNEAIARGIFEGNAIIAAAYPGTPSSEIMPVVAQCAKYHPEMKVEWSVNEKVAFEVAYAGSMSNVRAVAAMKHVGVNVASDAFMTAVYHGVRGGMVLISADDPSQFSSQNEQDNRYYGLHALAPVFEPSTPQEAKDMMKYAFEYSEKYNNIVVLRTTTRLNHGRADVEFGTLVKKEQTPEFDWDRNRWVCVPSNTRPQRADLLKRMARMTEDADEFPFNHLFLSEKTIHGKKIGFLAAGIAYSHLQDALVELQLEGSVSMLKLGLINPLPPKSLEKILKHVDILFVVEELEPIFEEQCKARAFDLDLSSNIEIHGKDLLPQQGELHPETIVAAVAKLCGVAYSLPEFPPLTASAPPRLPQMCPACSHRNIYWVMKKVAKKLKKKFANNNDIGCYSLGVYKPLEMADTALCMGGSIGMANGMAKILSDDVIVTAFLGDSTFFHSGIAPLVNAVYNKNEILVIISDNSFTSMTGGQDNPSNGILLTGEPGTRIPIEEVVKGCGVPTENIWVHEAYDMEGLMEKFEQAAKAKGVRVFIARHMCALQELRVFKKQKTVLPVIKVDSEKCTGCQICVRQFGCPAINFNFETHKAYIDQSQCRSCKSCIYICPQEAFYVEK